MHSGYHNNNNNTLCEETTKASEVFANLLPEYYLDRGTDRSAALCEVASRGGEGGGSLSDRYSYLSRCKLCTVIWAV